MAISCAKKFKPHWRVAGNCMLKDWRAWRCEAPYCPVTTPKEQEIADEVVSGKSSREISERYAGISARTVENHRARIMDKLHVDSAIELARLFL